jgi:tRNA A-37 threonylcarbamoyl transferase component Bud32/membrane-associated phospholipid phosphatase
VTPTGSSTDSTAPDGDRQPLDRVDEDALREEQRDEAGGGAEQADEGRARSGRGGRRRRPTGVAPPLPGAQRWGGVRWALIAAAGVTASLLTFAYLQPGPVLSLDEAASRGAVGLRTPASAAAARALDRLTDPVLVGVVRWGTILALLAVRRLRHLLVYVAALLAVEWAVQAMNFAIQRPRPMVEVQGVWDGFSHPSRPIAALTVTALASLRVLAPSGPVRRTGAAAVGVLVAAVGGARVLLGVDHVTDVVAAAAVAAGVVFALTRLVVPQSRHPVEYRRGQRAHLTLTPRRVEAIREAVEDQLGLAVRSVELHGEEGSAGSTPLRLDLADGDGAGREGPTALFAKLYTRQHLRSDRLYKFARLLLYGRMEDESSFASVRQLVQHEDHLSRLLRDGGVEVPEPYGIVEITPEQEYLVTFELVQGEDFPVEGLADGEVSDALLDACLELVEQLWVTGVAHRDIKPGNLLVHGDRATLIDVAFAQVRPSPWRQAVDLGAMLLLLCLVAEPDRVHARALRRFADTEIAEALAATDGVVVPAQLRRLLDERGWEARDRLRELAPHREPIRVQRWEHRRLLAAGLTAGGLALAVALLLAAFDTVGLL